MTEITACMVLLFRHAAYMQVFPGNALNTCVVVTRLNLLFLLIVGLAGADLRFCANDVLQEVRYNV